MVADNIKQKMANNESAEENDSDDSENYGKIDKSKIPKNSETFVEEQERLKKEF